MTRPYQRKGTKTKGPGRVGPGRRKASPMFQMCEGAGLSTRVRSAHQYCPYNPEERRWCCGSSDPLKCKGRAAANNYSDSLVSKTQATERVANVIRVHGFGAIEKARNDQQTSYYMRGE